MRYNCLARASIHQMRGTVKKDAGCQRCLRPAISLQGDGFFFA